MKAITKPLAFFALIIFAVSFMVAGNAAFTAKPTSSSIYVDGKLTVFKAYTINGNNYFKLRDIAMVLRGTEKQFDVVYIPATNAIEMFSGKAYTSVGGEMAVPDGKTVTNATTTISKIYLDGTEVILTAFTISGNNYFKLRDIGALYDFGVTWDGTVNAIRIDSSKGYEAGTEAAEDMIIDHMCTKLDQIPNEWIEKAKTDLHIAYGHTSHGSQITTGLLGLAAFKGDPYTYSGDGADGTLDLRDMPFGSTGVDLGAPDNKTWAEETRDYLNHNKDINVIMWSWCGQLSWADENYVNNYLRLMQELEADFPTVTFVYMTGHLDGSGETGTLERNNNQIRDFCMSNNKVLYDFADIESYNPDGVYFGDKFANDACDYDSDGDKKTDRNWAAEWQNTHVQGVDWYACTSAHSQPVNANMKAYAAWWLMARLVGWDA